MTFDEWWDFAKTQTKDQLTAREHSIAVQAWYAAVLSAEASHGAEAYRYRQDAERYRYLRRFNIGVGLREAPTWYGGTDLDKMIDFKAGT